MPQQEFDDEQFEEDVDATAIIIDNGSGFIKVGYGSSEKPKLEYPSIPPPNKPVGRYRAFSWNGQSFDPSQLRAKSLGIHPIERGVITRWNDMVCLSSKRYKNTNAC